MILIKNSKLYDFLKWLAQIALPGLGAAYFSLAGIWDLPDANKVVGTIVVVDTFLGVLLGLSTRAYNASDARFDGEIQVEERADGGKMANMVVEGDPEKALEKDELIFRVNKDEVLPVEEVVDTRPRDGRGRFTQ